MKKLLLLSLLAIQVGLYAQNGGVMNNWHFGWFAALEFTTGTPVAVSNSALISIEGCVSYSDPQGNLLFYSNGGNNNGNMFPAPGGVWNRNHEMMPNGAFNNTMGCMSAAQSTLVIPKSPTEYYLFTMGCGNGLNLRYCIVDMSLDGGLGDVTDMGTVLLDEPGTDLYEGITATHHSNGTDYWLIVHEPGMRYYTYLVSSTGISAPLIQTFGSSEVGSQLKFNLQGDKLMTNNTLFDFDKSTGTLSNPFYFSDNAYGLAFSPSGRYVYRRVITENTVKQYDINAVDILNSEVTIASGLVSPGGSIQIGPDMKLYVTNMNEPTLGVINDPDMPGLACNFVDDQVDLAGNNSQLGLPNFIDSELLYKDNALNALESIEVTVHPNPTRGEVFVTTSDATIFQTVDVLSLSGNRVAQYQFSERLRLNLAPGTYILEFKTENTARSRARIVVQ